MPRWDFLRPRGSCRLPQWSGRLLERLSRADPVTCGTWLTLPGDLPGPGPAPLPRGLRPDCAWALVVDLLASAGAFCGLSAALPLGLFELQVCLLVLITFWLLFLWAGVCLLAGLVVAGMAEGVEGRISGSRHGSQVNVYLPARTQLFYISVSVFKTVLFCVLPSNCEL